ncbi:hypothetical protein D3C75_969200 [compost metagenome]
MHHVPVISLETFGGVVGKPAFSFAINGNPVVIVETDELAEAESPRQRANFMRNAFHQAAITHKYVGEVVDDFVVGAVELRPQGAFRNRHPYSVC